MKTFKEFVNENVLENDIDRIDTLLNTIGAKKVHMGNQLDFNSDNFTSLEDLFKDSEFLNKLSKKNYKKNNIEYSKECETFLEDNLDIKFFLIFNEDDNELERPAFIVLQNKPANSYKWNLIKMYRVKDDMRKFYDALSNKTIELKFKGKNYIYLTSNAGKDWTLQNIQNKDNTFKTILSDDEIKLLMSSKGVTVNEV